MYKEQKAKQFAETFFEKSEFVNKKDTKQKCILLECLINFCFDVNFWLTYFNGKAGFDIAF